MRLGYRPIPWNPFRKPVDPSTDHRLAKAPAFAALSRRNRVATRLAARLFVEEGKSNADAVQLALRHHPAFRKFEDRSALRQVLAARDLMARSPGERALFMDRACVNLLVPDFMRNALRQRLWADPTLRWYDVIEPLPEHLSSKIGFFSAVNLGD